MFTNIIRKTIDLLRIVGLCEIPVENVVEKRLYYFNRFFSHYAFVYIPNILQIIYLTTVDEFGVNIIYTLLLFS